MILLTVWVVAHDVGMVCTVMEYSPIDYASSTVFLLVAYSDGASEHAKHDAFSCMTLDPCKRGQEGEPTVQQLCTWTIGPP